MAQFRPEPRDKALLDHFRQPIAREKINRLQDFLDEPDAPTPLTPMGMTRELVEKWHAEHFGLKIEAWKLELLASRIADLMVANTLEAVRGFEDYNGKHQIACMEIERLNRIIHEMQHMGLSLQQAQVLHPPR